MPITQSEKELYNLLLIENKLRMPEKMKAFLKEKKRYKFAWGGRVASKTVSICKSLLYIADTKKVRILCTREIQNSIKESVHSELSNLIDNLGYSNFEITNNSIFNVQTKSEFLFAGLWGQEKKQSIKGYDSIDIAWVEEAQAVSQGSLNILLPTIRKESSEIWFSYNPRLPDDPIELLRNRIPISDKVEVPINWIDNPYLSNSILKDIELSKQAYDNGISDDYLHVYLGMPICFSDKAIFKQKEIVESINRNISDEGQIEIGADIARFGGDRIVFFKRKGLKVIDFKVYQQLSTVETARYLMDFAENDKTISIKIDDTGIGGAITDMLLDQHYNVSPVNFGSSPKDKNKYNNAISEMWFEVKNKINDISIMDIQELKSELLTREWKLDDKGRRCVERKEDYKKRGFRSPDFADALLLCFYNPENNLEWAVF
jgi:phage terminase large subunit